MRQFKPVWVQLAKNKKVTKTDVFLYCLMRAMVITPHNLLSKQQVALDLVRKAFTPIQRSVRLNNGSYKYQAVYDAALRCTTLAMFVNSAHTYYSKFGDNLKVTCDPPVTLYDCFETHTEVDEFIKLRDAVLEQLALHLNDQWIFIFVRTDLPLEQQLVQATHAAFQLGRDLSDHTGNRPFNHVLIGVDNQEELLKACQYALDCHINIVPFYEPDLDNEMTAFVTSQLNCIEKRFLRRYRTWNSEQIVEQQIKRFGLFQQFKE